MSDQIQKKFREAFGFWPAAGKADERDAYAYALSAALGRIAQLEADQAAKLYDAIRKTAHQQRRRTLEELSRAAVNCGRHYGCWLANTTLAREKEADDE